MMNETKETRVPVLSLQMFLSAMSLTGVGLVAPRLADAFALDASQAGMLVSVQYFGAAVACVLSGVCSQRYGSSFMTRLFLAVSVPALLLFGYCANFPMALLGVFLLGGSVIGMQNSVMSAAIAVKDKGSFLNAVIQTAFSVGAIVLPFLFLLFLMAGVWRHLYLLLAALTVLLICFSRGRAEKGTGGRPLLQSFAVYGTYLTKPSFLLGAVVLALYQASEVGLWSLAPTLLESTGSGQLSGVVSNALIWTMILVGRLASTLLMRRVAVNKLLVPFGLLGLLSLTGLLFTNGGAAIFFAAAAGLAFAPFYAFISSWATRVSGDDSSAYVAFIMLMGAVGTVVLGVAVRLLGDTLQGGFIVLPSLVSFALMAVMLAFYGTRGDEVSSQ